MACGLKDPGLAPPTWGANSLAAVLETQPLPRVRSSGLAGKNLTFAYEPVVPASALKELISGFKGEQVATGTWPGLAPGHQGLVGVQRCELLLCLPRVPHSFSLSPFPAFSKIIRLNGELLYPAGAASKMQIPGPSLQNDVMG